MALLHTRVQGVMRPVDLLRTFAPSAALYPKRHPILGRAVVSLPGQDQVALC